ncbi:ubiquinol-cytochrome-c reductase complex assembly factor 4 [Engraulis encrasicolus]|uniref:ubiquinol-cytochrome-c reductase complex assembly factor 4 n=1 Tax=Engraulis encrasicolus TaxID=184585 RepID=UPI002FD1AA35
MSTTGQRLFCLLARYQTCRGIFINGNHTMSSHPVPARTLSASQSLLAKKPVVDDDEETNQPIKFTTSKASHRSWSVDRSLGSTYQRPWWRVLPFSVVGVGFVVWCFWRSETEVDQILEKELYDHIPGLLANEEEEEEEAGQTR